MKALRTSFKKHKPYFLFLFIIFLFGTLTGILFYFKQDISIRNAILSSLDTVFQNNVFAFKNILYHVGLLLFVSILLFCFLGIPILVVYIFIEGIAIGFLFPIFLSSFKINFLLYAVLYFVFIKLIYILLLFCLFLKGIKFIKVYVQSLKNKNYQFIGEFKYVLFFVFCVFLNDLLVYFVSNKILIFLLG